MTDTRSVVKITAKISPWPGRAGLLTAVIANTILNATGAWPPLELCWDYGSAIAPVCLVVFTAPVWGGGAILVLMG